jgi:hypothetical protein
MIIFCGNCGRKLENSWNTCPDCGKEWGDVSIPRTKPTPQPHQVQPYLYKYTKIGGEYNFGSGALVCGILGHILVFIWSFSFILILLLFIASAILGGFGIGKDENKSLAIAGFVLGIIGLICFIGGIPLWYIFLNYYYY